MTSRMTSMPCNVASGMASHMPGGVGADVAAMAMTGAEDDSGGEEERREERATKKEQGKWVLRGHPDASWLQDITTLRKHGAAPLTP
jgi:hypothetical protein